VIVSEETGADTSRPRPPSLAVEEEPAVRLRYGRFDPRSSFRSQLVPVLATGRYRGRWPAHVRRAPHHGWGLRQDHWPRTV